MNQRVNHDLSSDYTTTRCALCGRHVPERLTNVHHLHPRSHGGGEEVEVIMCRTCHSFIHATFSNRTLADSFNTLDKLREDPEVQKFVRWVRKQRPDRQFSADRRREKR